MFSSKTRKTVKGSFSSD